LYSALSRSEQRRQLWNISFLYIGSPTLWNELSVNSKAARW